MQSRQTTPPVEADAIAEPGLADLMVSEVLCWWPGTLPVFIQYRLACVGCLMGQFERLADVPRVYGLDTQQFLRDVQQAVRTAEGA